ncbi:hypothetical protein ACM792_14645 [Metapseudomonas otitidis]|uniref:hypothetical protein n=1 Tax=Metapseudomonas otitidis TaxID=319939 RepID=UPI0039FDD830
MPLKNIWYLPGPFHQYEEDVKALAKAAGLRIVDANATTSRQGEAESTPDVNVRPTLKMASTTNPGQGEIEHLRASLEAVGVLTDQLESGELVRPEQGEAAQRLYGSLSVLQESLRDLAYSHQVLQGENAELRRQLEALGKDHQALITEHGNLRGQGEVVELKAKLDAAGVTYRANASKEALEKLVAELP